MKKMLCALALITGLSPLALSALRPANPAPEDEAALVAELKLQTDNADPELVRKLASMQSRAALDGLLEVYDLMNSIYMRRAVLRGLADFDDVEGEEQRALQKMMDAATNSTEREMREIAVDEIASCRNYGKAFLAMIVESSAEDDVRERAMKHHTGDPRPEDRAWYMGIYEPEKKEKPRGGRRGSEEEVEVPHPLRALRELAFEVLVSDMDLPGVVEAARGGNRAIRRRAVQELDARKDPQALSFAAQIQSNPNETAEDRLFAVGLILRDQGAKPAEQLIKEATRAGTPEAYAFGLANLLGELQDETLNKRLLKDFGKGKGLKMLFSIHAGRHLADPKVDKALIKLLKDKEPRVQHLAMEIVGERRLKDALPELEKLVEKSKDQTVISEAFDTISSIRAGDPEWEARLVELVASENDDVRNGAVEVLGKTRAAKYLPVLVEALHHQLWSTRLAAARGIEHLRAKEGVGALCAQIGDEIGRMSLEMGDILFRLTGKPYRSQGGLWMRWWQEEGATFEIPTETELRRLRQEEEARRMKQISRSSFFGIKIESTRVIFILDVSGSMAEPTRGKYVGQQGAPRIDVARRELARCLDSLDTKSLFNMIVFSDGVEAWQAAISEKNEETLDDAKAFVQRIHAGGSTNLHGSLALAFEDPDVDTIFVLSDGEPTSGRVVDPGAIRSEVADWNEHRGVVIHCIAVGGSLSILEWLAADTGGTYVKFP